jgi:hypothetical protein
MVELFDPGALAGAGGVVFPAVDDRVGGTAIDQEVEPVQGVVGVLMLDVVRIGDALQVADLVVGVGGVAKVRVGHRLEPVQRVVGVAGVYPVGVAQPEPGQAAVGVIAVAQRAERRLLGRKLAPAVVVVDRRAGRIARRLALAVAGVDELDRRLAQRRVRHRSRSWRAAPFFAIAVSCLRFGCLVSVLI